jgi:hypothetical protein
MASGLNRAVSPEVDGDRVLVLNGLEEARKFVVQLLLREPSFPDQPCRIARVALLGSARIGEEQPAALEIEIRHCLQPFENVLGIAGRVLQFVEIGIVIALHTDNERYRPRRVDYLCRRPLRLKTKARQRKGANPEK